MSKLFILTGLPGSGKSTWAQNNLNKEDMFTVLLSSDEYREKLLSDSADQSNNELVFNTLYKDMREALSNGKDVCFDATNINRKSRRNAIQIAKSIKNVSIVSVIFATDIETVFQQNEKRNRRVPTWVITKFLYKFEVPVKGEGFDDIIIVDNNQNKSLWNNISQMIGFDQKNKHHSLDLHEHCKQCAASVIKKLNNSSLDISLVVAALFHDVGKLDTQTIDSETNEAHYLSHQNVGAYKALTSSSLFTFNDKKYTPDPYTVSVYINYHMEPYFIERMKKSKQERTIKELTPYWDNILILHGCDRNAH